MGLSGKIPQPGRDQRERHYKFTKIPATPNTQPPPDLVASHTERGRGQWARWWATPMSRMWGPFDADALERLLGLYEQTWAADPEGPLPSLAEIRQLEDRFGLTPASRARLCWQVEGVDIPAVTPERLGHDTGERAQPAAGGAADPRRLKVVS